MRRFYFKPHPWLTLIAVVMLYVLIKLGAWQYQRLEWKTDILAEIEASATAQPFSSIPEVKLALENEEPVEYRRIELSAEQTEFKAPFRVFSREAVNAWRVYAPIRANGAMVFAQFELLLADKQPEARSAEPIQIIGYVRLAKSQGRWAAQSNSEQNRWYGFNPEPDTNDWSGYVPGGAETRFYIETVDRKVSASELPARRPDIRNNHFDYMLTWWGLAIVLMVFYIIIHKRDGRIGWS